MSRGHRRHDAAGGVVVDEGGRVALLEREVGCGGRFVTEVRLPQGPLRPGESDEQAALREVAERTGLVVGALLADLGTAEVEHVSRGVHYLRRERWFLVRAGRSLVGRLPAAGRPDRLRIASDLADAVRRLSRPSEQGAVLRARAWAGGEAFGRTAGPGG